jgi:hypothetical protein
MALRSFIQPFKVSDATDSTSNTTGAITVSGGIGVTGNIQSNGYLGVGGAVGDATYPLNVTGAAKISSYLGIGGAIGSSTYPVNVTGDINVSGTASGSAINYNVLKLNTGYYAGFNTLSGNSTYHCNINGECRINNCLGVGVANYDNTRGIAAIGGLFITGTNGIGLGYDVAGTNWGVAAASGGAYIGLNSFNASSYPGPSDIRIKKNIEIIDDAESLNIIRNIYPKKFTFIEDPENKEKIGFIAQDLDSIIPYVIHKESGYIPDIYEYATIVFDEASDSHIITLKYIPNNVISKGSLLKIYVINKNDPRKEMIINIEEIIDEKTFTIINKELNNTVFDDDNKLFIYGRQIQDFNFVNYNIIQCIFISAFQELIRQFEIEIENTKKIVTRIKFLEDIIG